MSSICGAGPGRRAGSRSLRGWAHWGLEALSRGAQQADFVEQAAASLRALRANIDALGAGDRAHVHRIDAIRFMTDLAPGAYDVAFADPPYGRGLAAAVAARWLETPFAGVLGIEHARTEGLPHVEGVVEDWRANGATLCVRDIP